MAELPPIGLKWRSSTAYILTCVAIGRFTDVFVYSLALPVLPFLLHDRLDISPSQLQGRLSELLAVFSAATLICAVPAGYLADIAPTRRGPYLVGLIMLMSGTLLFGVANSFATLVTARILQGVSVALVNSAGMAMVIDTVGSENLGRSLGTLYSFLGVADLASPAIGGILYAKTGVKGVLGLSLAAITVDLALRILLIEKKVAARYNTVSEVSTANKIDEPNERNFLLPREAQKALGCGIRSERSAVLHCLRNPRLLVALSLAFLQAFIYGVYDATLVPNAEVKFGFSSLGSGLLFIPLGVPNLLLASVVGRGIDKYGIKVIATIGFSLFAPCFALVRFPTHSLNQDQRIAVEVVILSLQGICITLISAPSIVEATYVMEDFEKDRPGIFGPGGSYGKLFGLHTLVFQAGLTAGPICGGLLRAYVGYGNLYLVMAALSSIAATFSFSYLGPPEGKME